MCATAVRENGVLAHLQTSPPEPFLPKISLELFVKTRGVRIFPLSGAMSYVLGYRLGPSSAEAE